jgi:RND family efflux transporter MFP subunit
MITEIETPQNSGQDARRTPGGSLGKLLPKLLLVVAAILVVLIVRGILARTHAEASLAQATERNADLVVRTVHPRQGTPSMELVLPGNIEAFTDTPIYARTDGYLRRWYFDIGAHVKAGQLLAEIETPELDQQLAQAQADLATAEANANNAHINAERYSGLIKQNAVSQQDTDTFVNQAAATSSAVRSAQANVRRLRELQSFEKIYAPFDGVITARDLDIGNLINAGSSAGARELFHLEAINRLRVFVQVPQASSRAATPGTPVDLVVPELAGQHFPAQVARTSDAMEITSRTMRVEVDVDNPHGTLIPGELATVHLKLPTPVNSLIVPVNAVLFRSEGISAVVVQNDKIAIVPVTIGRDFGDSLEVTSGLNANDQIVVNPPDSIAAGQKVQMAAADAQ